MQASEGSFNSRKMLAPNKPTRLQALIRGLPRSKVLRRLVGRPYLRVSTWAWNHLPSSARNCRMGWKYGAHLHRLIQLRSTRWLATGTFFFRNRPELELLVRLLEQKENGSTLDLAILGCSKGAEVYTFLYVIRCVRPDLKVSLHAVDIEPDVLEFAERGVYSLKRHPPQQGSSSDSVAPGDELAVRTFGDQKTWLFERMSPDEIEAMFECEGEQARVKPRFREGVTWHLGSAGDPQLVESIGLQDIVVANRFLCHMQPEEAETCLRSLVRLVKPGGYLFVSGVDLEVRTKVAKELGWMPVTELINEIHEGDPSLRQDWPMQYWGLEPFDQQRNDWETRYSSVFQIGAHDTLPPELCTRREDFAIMGTSKQYQLRSARMKFSQ